MTEDEIMNIDLDIVNLLKKLPLGEGHAHYYFSVRENSISDVGAGDTYAMMEGFNAMMNRRSEDGGDELKNAILSTVAVYLKENKKVKKLFLKNLKNIKL